jgi:energy-coupling factor transporter ATP-binding protein EcfA2
MIQLDRVTKSFEGKRRVTALDNVSLTIPRGEMVSIIGTSGSGKSTLLNLVGGLDRASSGSVQVDADTLEPIPFASRADQITRLVADMRHLAEFAPFDALLAAQRTPLPECRPLRAVEGTSQAGTASPDVHRLLKEGLYEGLRRNEAALALARHWMLWLRWNATDTAVALFEWTRTMTNGRSKDALQIEAPRVAKRLGGEYRRICVNLERKIRSGVLTIRTTAHGARALLSASECEAVFGAATNIVNRSERYRFEVFLFCFLGFAKRYGTPAPNLTDDAACLPTFVEVAATTMQKWPNCSGNGYVKRLRVADDHGVIASARAYRPPAHGRSGRARTYRVDLDGLPARDTGLDAWAILEVQRRSTNLSLQIAHPQEIEHAIVARAKWGRLLVERYGRRAAARIVALAAAYDMIVARPTAAVA